jgi:hypothetical protein
MDTDVSEETVALIFSVEYCATYLYNVIDSYPYKFKPWR